MANFGAAKRFTAIGEAQSTFSEEILVSAAQAGQEWAFVELCSRCSKRILIMLYKITKNPEDAEDILQESILKAYIHFGEFNRASIFSTWLTRISINSALMILRRRRVRPEVSIDLPADTGNPPLRAEMTDRRPNAEDHYIQLETEVRLKDAISRLPMAYRHVIEIRQQSEGSIKEVAAQVGITVAATKSRLMRATKTLRNSLSEQESRSSRAWPLSDAGLLKHTKQMSI